MWYRIIASALVIAIIGLLAVVSGSLDQNQTRPQTHQQPPPAGGKRFMTN